MYSAGAGNVSVLKLLLDAGADAQAVGGKGSTALHQACQSSAACVELLLARQAISNFQSQSCQADRRRGRRLGKVLSYPDKCETYAGARECLYTERGSAAYAFAAC